LPQIIALHGDFASPGMLKRDMGNVDPLDVVFFDGKRWINFAPAMGRLITLTIANAKTYIADPEAWDFYA